MKTVLKSLKLVWSYRKWSWTSSDNVQLMNKFSVFPCKSKQVNRGTKMCQHTDGQGDSNSFWKQSLRGYKKIKIFLKFNQNCAKWISIELPNRANSAVEFKNAKSATHQHYRLGQLGKQVKSSKLRFAYSANKWLEVLCQLGNKFSHQDISLPAQQTNGSMYYANSAKKIN